MKTTQNAIIWTYFGKEHVSFLNENVDPIQAIANRLYDLVTRNAVHTYGDVYNAVAVRQCSTEHKNFDRKSSGGDQISEGNIRSNVMIGQYIRPFNETECNGPTYTRHAQGELQAFDIAAFRNHHDAHTVFSRWANTVPEMKTDICIAYSFFTRTGRKITDIGYLLVRAADRKVLRCQAAGERIKNETVMYAMRARLSSEGVTQRTRVATLSVTGLIVYDPTVFGLLKARDVSCRYEGPLDTAA